MTQELISVQNRPSFKPHFWIREKKVSNAEIDIIFQYGKYIIPIEIKAGKSGRLRSLHLFMDRTNHNYAIRLYNGPLVLHEITSIEGKLLNYLTFPIFWGCMLPQYVKWLVDTH